MRIRCASTCRLDDDLLSSRTPGTVAISKVGADFVARVRAFMIVATVISLHRQRLVVMRRHHVTPSVIEISMTYRADRHPNPVLFHSYAIAIDIDIGQLLNNAWPKLQRQTGLNADLE